MNKINIKILFIYSQYISQYKIILIKSFIAFFVSTLFLWEWVYAQSISSTKKNAISQNTPSIYERLARLKKLQLTRSKHIIWKKLNQEKMIASLSLSKDKQLKKLSEYKSEIQGEYGKEMMIFMNMPMTDAWIEDIAQNMKNIISEYKKNQVKPIFLFEPYDENLNEIHFKHLKNGAYDDKLKKIFSKLKYTYNISVEDIGVLVPYPEINTPAFERQGFQPEDFSPMINSFFETVREVYPTVEGWILLDSKTYSVWAWWWEWSFSSFMPYIQNITPGTLNRFWIQGFPWVSNDGSIEAYDPKEYLPLGITLEASKFLGVESIWYNTGVMKKKYKKNTITLSHTTTDQILENTLKQATELKKKWYGVFINIFAQDKFDHYEVTDWSFLGTGEHQDVLKKFIFWATDRSVAVSIYDK